MKKKCRGGRYDLSHSGYCPHGSISFPLATWYSAKLGCDIRCNADVVRFLVHLYPRALFISDMPAIYRFTLLVKNC